MTDLCKLVNRGRDIGATHIDEQGDYWILSKDLGIKSQVFFIDTFNDLSTDGFSFRSLDDMDRIIKLESFIKRFSVYCEIPERTKEEFYNGYEKLFGAE